MQVAAIRRGAAAVFLLNRPSARATATLKALQELAATCTASTCTVRGIQGNAGGAVKPPTAATAVTAVTHIDCDLQSFGSVRHAAAQLNAASEGLGGLDVLVNNAGVMALPDVRTVDGFDVQV